MLMRAGKSNLPQDQDRAFKMLESLTKLCQTFKGKFHIFGLNWLQTLNQLHPYLASADSSVHLDGAQYYKLIHRTQDKRKFLLSPARDHLSPEKINRTNLSAMNARNLQRFLAKQSN